MLIFSKKNDKISQYFYAHQEDVADCFESFEEFFKLLFSENPDRNLLESTKVAVDNHEAAADQELIHIVNTMRETYLPATRKNLISLAQSTVAAAIANGTTETLVWKSALKAAIVFSCAALTVFFMSYLKFPVSTSQAVVGAVGGGRVDQRTESG